MWGPTYLRGSWHKLVSGSELFTFPFATPICGKQPCTPPKPHVFWDPWHCTDKLQQGRGLSFQTSRSSCEANLWLTCSTDLALQACPWTTENVCKVVIIGNHPAESRPNRLEKPQKLKKQIILCSKVKVSPNITVCQNLSTAVQLTA